MLVQFVAQSPDQVRTFLCEEAGVHYVGPIEITNEVRRWHDDVWEDVTHRADLGEIWPVFTAELREDCQSHIDDFTDYQKLDSNYLFIMSRSFCASCNYTPDVSSVKTESYIIA